MSLLTEIQQSNNPISPGKNILPDHVLNILQALSSDDYDGVGKSISVGETISGSTIRAKEKLVLDSSAKQGLRREFSGSNGISVSGYDPIQISIDAGAITDSHITGSGISKISDASVGVGKIDVKDNASPPNDGDFLKYDGTYNEMTWAPQEGISDNQITNSKLSKMDPFTIKSNPTTDVDGAQDFSVSANSVLGRKSSGITNISVSNNEVIGRLGGDLTSISLTSNDFKNAIGIPTRLSDLRGWPIDASEIEPGHFTGGSKINPRYYFDVQTTFKDNVKIEDNSSLIFDEAGSYINQRARIGYDAANNTLEIISGSDSGRNDLKIEGDTFSVNSNDNIILNHGSGASIMLHGKTTHKGFSVYEHLPGLNHPKVNDIPSQGAAICVATRESSGNEAIYVRWSNGDWGIIKENR